MNRDTLSAILSIALGLIFLLNGVIWKNQFTTRFKIYTAIMGGIFIIAGLKWLLFP
jgi:drug/metabolite transporter superfamily protein YnfA